QRYVRCGLRHHSNLSMRQSDYTLLLMESADVPPSAANPPQEDGASCGRRWCQDSRKLRRYDQKLCKEIHRRSRIVFSFFSHLSSLPLQDVALVPEPVHERVASRE